LTPPTTAYIVKTRKVPEVSLAFRHQLFAVAAACAVIVSLDGEKYLEMVFSSGKLTRTASQFGQGLPSAVQTGLSACTPIASAK
jgi:hypothetical protein